MTRGGERSAVVHRSNNGHTGWHLVIEQPPHLLPQDRRNLAIQCIVRPVGGRIDAARQVPFETTCDLQQFRFIRCHDDQRRVAEGFGLKPFWMIDELLTGNLQQSILAGESRSATFFSAG